MTEGITDVVVRDARQEEHPRIRELTLAAYAEYEAIMAPSAWAGLSAAVRSALEVREGAGWIVAERAGGLVGSVLLYPPTADAYGGAAERAPWPELRLLSVAPGARGEGIGRLLVEECVRRAAASGASAIGLHTSRSMASAIRMYEAMGFRRAPEYDFRPEGAELVTAYRLDLP